MAKPEYFAAHGWNFHALNVCVLVDFLMINPLGWFLTFIFVRISFPGSTTMNNVEDLNI
jgi:hypothetical protein